jgi:hypothetical protein
MKIKVLLIFLIVISLGFSGCVKESGIQDDVETDGYNNKGIITDSEHNQSGKSTGWYLKEIKDYGDKISSTNDYYSYDITYERGNVTTVIFGGDGQELRVRTTHYIAPDFIEAEDLLLMYVKKEGLVVNHGGLGLYDTSSVSIDFPELDLGYASSSKYHLQNDTYGNSISLGYGDEPGTIKEGIFSANVPKANEFNGNFSITVSFQNGALYGTEYIYEWRE